MPITDTHQPRFPWVAAPIAGVLALSLAAACSAAGTSARAPAPAQPDPGPPSSSPPVAPTSSPTAQESTRTASTLPPVPRGTAATFGTGVRARITAVAPITAIATAPGDIAGPALAISLRLANGGTEAVSVDDVTVTATDATGAPASPVTGDQAHPFSGSIPPGAARTATYPFRIPANAATGALIVVSYRAGVPIATLMI